jgi:hypothetical protein
MRSRLFKQRDDALLIRIFTIQIQDASSNITATATYPVATHLSIAKILDPNFLIGGNPIISPITSAIRATFLGMGLKTDSRELTCISRSPFHHPEYSDRSYGDSQVPYGFESSVT